MSARKTVTENEANRIASSTRRPTTPTKLSTWATADWFHGDRACPVSAHLGHESFETQLATKVACEEPEQLTGVQIAVRVPRFAQKLSLTCQIFSKFQFPDSAEGGLLLCGVGQSEFELAMTHRVITLEFVVPTVVAIALGILLSMGAVYVTDRYLGPPDQPEAYRSAASGR
jgi:hypothetical protein